jgi:hypothetical protein
MQKLTDLRRAPGCQINEVSIRVGFVFQAPRQGWVNRRKCLGQGTAQSLVGPLGFMAHRSRGGLVRAITAAGEAPAAPISNTATTRTTTLITM